MTPKELCDLASKINSAVPGLTKTYLPSSFCDDVYENDGMGQIQTLTEAASMMLGRVDAFLENCFGHPSEDLLLEIRDTLSKFVITTLPGAKA